MNKYFSEMCEKEVPKFNPDTVNGLAYKYMENTEQWVDSVMKSASDTFDNGLTYLGYERVSPGEEYLEMSKKKDLVNRKISKANYDIARSDIYLVKYFFKFNGEPMPPRYMYLPYCTKGGLMHMSGTLYHISPVLSDRVITPGPNSVFIRLLRDKLHFSRIYYNVKVNGIKQALQVIHSPIFKRRKDNNRVVSVSSKMVTGASHYLLSRLGMRAMFERYFNFIPDIGTDEINVTNYPVDKWIIFESCNVIPKGLDPKEYVPHGIKIAVPISKYKGDVTRLSCDFMTNMITGIFYVMDHFPFNVGIDMIDDPEQWMVILGYVNKGESFTIDKLHKDMTDHLKSLDAYMDPIIVKKLSESGYFVNTFYDLLALILDNFNDWTTNHKEYANNVYNRYLDVLYYILYDITTGIFKANYELVQLAGKKKLTLKNVNDNLSKHMSVRRIYQLVKSSSPNISTNVVDYSGDNLYPKITSVVVLQESGNGVKRSTTGGLPPSSRYLTASDISLGSLLFLTKKLPTPKVRLNPFAMINLRKGTVEPSDSVKETIALLGFLLDGKDPDDVNKQLKEKQHDTSTIRPNSSR